MASSSSTSSASNNMVFHSVTANTYFSTAEEVRYEFSSIFNDTQQAIPGLEDFSFSYGVLEGGFAHIRGYLHSSSKIAEASVQGYFPTLEYRPKPLAGHLYGLAKMASGGRTPKSKTSLQHARTAAGNSSTA